MPIHFFSGEELWVLWMLSGFEISEYSPLDMLDRLISGKMTNKNILRICKELYKSKCLIYVEGIGYDVNPPLLPMLYIISQPEDMVIFTSTRELNNAKVIFMRRSRTIVQHIPTLDYNVHVITYPWNKKLIATWLSEEVDSRVPEPIEIGTSRFTLNPIEAIMLIAIQQVFRKKLMKKRKKLLISKKEVSNAVSSGSLISLPLFVRSELFRKLLIELADRPDIIDDALSSLEYKGVISLENNYINFTDDVKSGLDVRNMVDYGIAYYRSINGDFERGMSISYQKDRVSLVKMNGDRNIELIVTDTSGATRLIMEDIFMPMLRGVKERKALYCPNCGEEVDLDSVYCPYCGHKLK